MPFGQAGEAETHGGAGWIAGRQGALQGFDAGLSGFQTGNGPLLQEAGNEKLHFQPGAIAGLTNPVILFPNHRSKGFELAQALADGAATDAKAPDDFVAGERFVAGKEKSVNLTVGLGIAKKFGKVGENGNDALRAGIGGGNKGGGCVAHGRKYSAGRPRCQFRMKYQKEYSGSRAGSDFQCGLLRIENGVFEGHVAGAFLGGAEEIGVKFVKASDVEVGVEESAPIHNDGAGMDFAAQVAAFKDAQGAVAIDAGGELAMNDQVAHADGVGNDDVGSAFHADAAGADFAIEASGGSNPCLAIAEKPSGDASADIRRTTNAELIVEIAEFFDGQFSACIDGAGEAFFHEHVVEVNVCVAIWARRGGSQAWCFVNAGTFVAAHATKFRRTPAVVKGAQFFDLRLIAQEPRFGRLQGAPGQRLQSLDKWREFFTPCGGRARCNRRWGGACGRLAADLEVLSASAAESADNSRRLLLGRTAFRAGDRLFRDARRHDEPALDQALFGGVGRRCCRAG